MTAARPIGGRDAALRRDWRRLTLRAAALEARARRMAHRLRSMGPAGAEHILRGFALRDLFGGRPTRKGKRLHRLEQTAKRTLGRGAAASARAGIGPHEWQACYYGELHRLGWYYGGPAERDTRLGITRNAPAEGAGS